MRINFSIYMKSTLLKIILGLLKPTSGDLYLNGKHYARIDQRNIFKKFGYMTQNPVLFNRSIIDNIIFIKFYFMLLINIALK